MKRALLVLLLAGCESVIPTAGGAPAHYPVAGCEGIDASPCDIRTATCQSRLMAMAVCLRGEGDPTLPPVTLMTEAQLGEYLNAQVVARDPTPEAQAARDSYDKAMVMLGLAEPGALSATAMAMQQTSFLYGLYRQATKDILVIDHGDGFDLGPASSILVHELVHALQDRQVDLSNYFGTRRSDDSYLAADALVEGEAVLRQATYDASVLGLDGRTIDWVRHFQSRVDDAERAFAQASSPYALERYDFLYAFGARYLNHVRTLGGDAAVRARFGMPPVDTRALFASVDSAVDDAAPPVLTVPTADSPWEPVAGNRMGAIGLYLFALGAPGYAIHAEALARAWRSDALGVYRMPTGETAVVWRVQLGDADALDLFVKAAGSQLGASAVFHKELTAGIALSDGATEIPWALWL